MARTKADGNDRDPATGRPLPPGVTCRGPRQYRARKLVDGKRVNRTFETARLAREWLEAASASARAGEFVDRGPLARTTLKAVVERFLEEVLFDGGPRRGAAEDRASHIPSIQGDEIHRLPLSRLTPAAVRGYRDRMVAADYAGGTVVKRLNLLSGILSHAINEWDYPMPLNPASASAVPRPKGADRKRTRKLEPAPVLKATVPAGGEPPKSELERLTAALAESPCAHDLPFVLFALAQGTRRGEQLGLRWRDVDFERRLLTLHGRHGLGTKMADTREEEGPEVRPLMQDAVRVLRGMLPQEGEPEPEAMVFLVGSGSAFSVRFGRLTRKAGLENLRLHDMRHDATTRLAKRYKNALDLKRVTGHRKLASLDRYYQPDLTELAKAGDVPE